ncbi:hypothetical protein AVEN_154529-1 [Araneus ventricosus]|uniref:Uncharacterized protein n=1 Tax=Araneus ventricosus TaxID=182803 RepID=A0A4Y2Q547_ARAVE|nr:hypothetical protein AVEN_149750-1 [Araneus ventricosus]GBN58020.1 hypothetical protein AVEN_154529-1 [Araneus ventricosus]
MVWGVLHGMTGSYGQTEPIIDWKWLCSAIKHKKGIFQDDNGYVSGKKWFEIGLLVAIIGHIKHIWDMIARSVLAENFLLATLLQLWKAVEAVWLNISSGDFRRLAESMPRQVAALLRAKEGST